MSVKLVLPWKLRRGHLYRATDQRGVRAVGCVPAAGNEGHLRPRFGGLVNAELAHRLEITTAGDVGEAKWKLSVDGGSTWLGHSSAFTDAEGGGANSRKTVLSSANNCLPSKVALADTAGYEQVDAAFMAVVESGAVRILRSAALLRNGSEIMSAWTEVCADATGAHSVSYRAQLLERADRLFLVYQVADAIYVRMSRATATDALGVLWGSAYQVIGSGVREGNAAFDACVLPNGLFFVAFDRAATSTLVQCRTARGINSWSTSKTIATLTDAAHHIGCAYLPELESLRVVLSVEGTADSVTMYESDDDIPTSASATWEASSESLAAAATVIEQPFIAVGHDGTYWIGGVNVTAAPDAFTAWEFKDGAEVTARTNRGEAQYASCSVVLGTLWAIGYNQTTDILGATFSRYWESYSAGVNDVLTGAREVLAVADARYLWGGSDGIDGDYWDADTVADYAAERMAALTPSRPTRSVGDGAAWEAVFDLGSGNPLLTDTLLAQANVRKLFVQFADGTTEPTWTGGGAPTLHEISFILDSFTPSSETPGIVSVAADRFVPGEHAGRIAYSASLAKQVLVLGNDARRLWFSGDDLDGHAGALEILHPKAWLALSEVNTRWVRVSVEAQQTRDGYYEVAVLLGGVAIECASNVRAYPSERQQAYGDPFEYEVDALTVGQSLITPIGTPVEDWRLSMQGGTLDQKKQIGAAQFGAQATTVPFGLIPDSANTHSWALVRFPRAVRWSVAVTEWELETVL